MPASILINASVRDVTVDAVPALPPDHLFANLVARAKAEPDSVFCHLPRQGRTETVTNRQIVAEAAGIAARLVLAGVRPGEIVPIVLEHRRELYSSFIACTLVGAAPTLLPPLTAKQDPVIAAKSIAALLARIDPSCVISSWAARSILDAGERCVIDLDEPPATSPSRPWPTCSSADGLAFLQHSSGTTGLKKGVALSHAAVARQITGYAAAIGANAGDAVASWLPLYHDMGLITSFLMPAVIGIPIVSLDAMEWTIRPGLLLDAIERHRATLCWLPNFAFHHIVRMADPNRQWDLTSLRMLISCSEPCRVAAFDSFTKRFANSGLAATALQTCYAMAENVFAVTQTTQDHVVRPAANPKYRQFLSCGGELANATVRIAGADGTAAPEGEPGEIWLTSDCLFEGYFRQPELSAERLHGDWYQTGDLGFFEDGQLFVVGRRDDMLNINGRKIIAHEIEDDLNDIEGVAPGRVLVYAAHDAATGATQMVVAAERAVRTASADEPIMAAIRRRVLDNCGMRPGKVMLLERGFLVKSTSGKISRDANVRKIHEREVST